MINSTYRLVLIRKALCARNISTKYVEITKITRKPSWSLMELHSTESITNEEINHTVLTQDKLLELADLCHLHIEESKLPDILRDVESIIQCARTIHVMTKDENIGEQYYQSQLSNDTRTKDLIAPLREDVVTEGNYADQVLANATEKYGNYFQVPKVLQD